MNGYISYNEDIGMNVTEKLFEKMLKFKNNNTINVR